MTNYLHVPLLQDPKYHQFADNSVVFGVPHFWNVTSNIGFLIVAGWGIKILRTRKFEKAWERVSFTVLLAGIAVTALGSIYYHLNPCDATLFWDRLPMTVVFMCIFSLTIGSSAMLTPALCTGVLSVVYWRVTGDLRPYAIVQYLPLLALPLILLRRRANDRGMWAMICFYLLAKGAEMFDQQIARLVPGAGHPWKHILATLALVCYIYPAFPPSTQTDNTDAVVSR